MRDDLWADGIVPYKIEPGLLRMQQTEEAIEQWNSSGLPVELVKHEEGQDDYVEFVSAKRCSSEIGCSRGRQEITLSPDCRTGMVLHEIGHAVGLMHEHSRHDRDQCLERICLENIYPAALGNFKQQPDNGDRLGAYDFKSIMHYSQIAFSHNCSRTIMPRAACVPSDALIGQRRELSAGDIQRLQYLYGEDARSMETPAPRTVVSLPPAGRSSMRTVTGRIVVPPEAPRVSATLARVRVRDITYSAIPLTPVVEIRMLVEVAPEADIEFSIDLPDGLSTGPRLDLEVHIDLDGSGYFSPGDLVSMQLCPVLPATPAAPIDVPVSVA